ncbi:hypothetical protein GCM10023196_069480 [Actinoallomurus vinaceus]|uniref:Uncharacterized protein n=1 Tax=Actinoallomurus vinaceus TaxID=1080074 RepID=A0ABP8ULW6_9ACTN
MNNRRPVEWLLHVGRRRLFINILILVTILMSSGLVALSPFALTYLNVRKSTDWNQLSAIGQTYGAASALLAGLALLGIAASLVFQAREAKATREQALRALHGDLMKMAMEDPLYRACWGAFFSSEDEDAQRAHMYVNMIINHWLLMWELNAITEEHLRAIARVVLSGEIGHRFWSDGRDLRMASAGTKRERRFNRILDEEYRKAPAPPPRMEVETVSTVEVAPEKRTLYAVVAGVLLGAAGASVARRVVKAKTDHRG